LAIQFAAIVSSVVVARIAGPTVLGTVTYALAFAHTFGFISHLGLGGAHVKLVSGGRDLKDCLGTYIPLMLTTTLIYVAIAGGVFIYVKKHSPSQFETRAMEISILLSIALQAFTSINGIMTTTFNARIEQAKQDVPQLVNKVLYNFGRIAVVLLGFRAVGLSSWSLMAIILLFLSYLWMFKDYPIGRFDLRLAREYALIALPMSIMGFTNSQLVSLDKVLLKSFTSAVEVGYYGASFRIGGFIHLIGGSIGLLFFPLFSKAFAERRLSYISDKILSFERFSEMFILPLVMLVVVFSGLIVNTILGPKYIPSIVPMAIMTFALYVSVQNTPYMNVLTGKGRFYFTAMLQLTQVAVLVAAMIAFVHPRLLNLRSVGAALALLTVHLYSAALFRVLAAREVPSINLLKNIKIIGCVLAISGVYAFVHHYLAPGSGIINLILAGSFIPVQYLALFLLKISTREDFAMVTRILNPKSVKDYISKEFKDKTRD
jgi:O-antigen/teichoic acid export membrane protein